MALTVEKLREVAKMMTEDCPCNPPYFHCKSCGELYLVLGDVPKGGMIVCDNCTPKPIQDMKGRDNE